MTVQTEIPTEVSHGKAIAVIELFKILVSALLNGNNNFIIHYGIVPDSNIININCYCDKKDVGMLLGRKEAGLLVPTKWSIIRLLNIVAYHAGIFNVMLKVDDFSKIPDIKEEDGETNEETK